MFFAGQTKDEGWIHHWKKQLNQVVIHLKIHVKNWFYHPIDLLSIACLEMISLMVECQIPVPDCLREWNKN